MALGFKVSGGESAQSHWRCTAIARKLVNSKPNICCTVGITIQTRLKPPPPHTAPWVRLLMVAASQQEGQPHWPEMVPHGPSLGFLSFSTTNQVTYNRNIRYVWIAMSFPTVMVQYTMITHVMRRRNHITIQSSHSSAAEDLGLWRCDTVWWVRDILKEQGVYIFTSQSDHKEIICSSCADWFLKTKAQCSFVMLGTTHPVTWYHITQDWNPQGTIYTHNSTVTVIIWNTLSEVHGGEQINLEPRCGFFHVYIWCELPYLAEICYNKKWHNHFSKPKWFHSTWQQCSSPVTTAGHWQSLHNNYTHYTLWCKQNQIRNFRLS
jgi:hypothetical protein